MGRNGFALKQVFIWRHGLLLVPLIFLALFFFFPLLTILLFSLFPQGQADFSGFLELMTSAYYRDTFVFTLIQAMLSTLLTLALAVPSAYVFTRFQFPGKTLWMAVATLPFVLPTVVVAAGFNALLGPRGLLNMLLIGTFHLETPPIQMDRTLTLILIVHAFYNFSVALRLITGYWANQSPRIEEAARALGVSDWTLWWRVRLPLLRPALIAAALLVFIFTFTSFGVVLILGGPRFATVEVEIYRQANDLFNLPMAAALSLVQIVFMFVLMLFYTRLQRRMVVSMTAQGAVARVPRSPGQRLLVGVTVGGIAFLLGSPLVALVLRSVSLQDGVGLFYYQQLGTNVRGSVLFVPPAQAIGNSLLFALLTTLLSVSLGTVTAYLLSGRVSRLAALLDPLFMLPLATSAVTLGFGYIIAFDEPPLNLRTSPLLIPLAHTLVAMPFVVRSVLPALRAIPPNLAEAARSLGASGWRVWWRVEVPLISRGIIVGATFAFTVSMGEFGASLFIARPDTPTIPLVIFRLLGQPGALNYGQAMAMSSILLLVCALAFVGIERLRKAGIGEF
jgi:thiamine transport system permease protein